MNRDKSFRYVKSSGKEDRNDFVDVGRDEILDELLSVVVDGMVFFDGNINGGKVVIG